MEGALEGLATALLAAAATLGLGVGALAAWVRAFGLQPRPASRWAAPRLDAVVVLGARVLPGGRPSGALRARVLRGAGLVRAGVAPRLVLSGGLGRHPPEEAQVMRTLALEAGVPEGSLVLEAESRDTRGNARHTAVLLRALGARDVAVVSDGFHLLRARQSFRAEGVEVATAPASLAGRGLTRGRLARWYVREAVSLLTRPGLWRLRPR